MHLNKNLKTLVNYINYSWSLETIYKTILMPKISFSLFSKLQFLVCFKIIFVFKTKTGATELHFQVIFIFTSWWKIHLVKKHLSDRSTISESFFSVTIPGFSPYPPEKSQAPIKNPRLSHATWDAWFILVFTVTHLEPQPLPTPPSALSHFLKVRWV